MKNHGCNVCHGACCNTCFGCLVLEVLLFRRRSNVHYVPVKHRPIMNCATEDSVETVKTVPVFGFGKLVYSSERKKKKSQLTYPECKATQTLQHTLFFRCCWTDSDPAVGFPRYFRARRTLQSTSRTWTAIPNHSEDRLCSDRILKYYTTFVEKIRTSVHFQN